MGRAGEWVGKPWYCFGWGGALFASVFLHGCSHLHPTIPPENGEAYVLTAARLRLF